MKSEPADFSIEDLRIKKREPWTGVRNYQARNSMRDSMKIDDQILFYHSNITPPGIAGIAKVASLPYPDPTQFDENSDYFDPRATLEKPIWYLVDIIFVEQFPKLISLNTLQQSPDTAGMVVCKRGMRLSVQPVTPQEFSAVIALAKK